MNIHHEIEKLFQQRQDIPLFYIESGSRLWGMASPDSDYDVRGFHLPSKDQYFDYKKHRDLIEIMEDYLEIKKQQKEKAQLPEVEQTAILQLLETKIEQLAAKEMKKSDQREGLERYLTEYSRHLKQYYYYQ
ncbi:DNA polymerase beta superfamily protein [Acinetobacter ursingii]|uniref:DNA polymerase beta superfamily protein n=1 Tax=Acinetobacter ursingii TaxID=108980 RepID=UPI0005C814C7|nr:nucleotidyltransferase domain-containing protein [Acinetobacter ursingii]